MKLTKKHIGQLFDNDADGSWIYQLVDVNRKGHCLFWSFSDDAFVVCSQHDDWVTFKPKMDSWLTKRIKEGWKNPKYGLKDC